MTKVKSASQLLTLSAFAREFDISYRAAWAMVSSGQVRAIRIGPRGGRWRIPISEVERLLTDGVED